jgi:outer membrane protein OmpA-like peptidoglycan-associated protein
MDLDPKGARAQEREQEERIVVALAIAVGLLLIPFLLAWFGLGPEGRTSFRWPGDLFPPRSDAPAVATALPEAPPLPAPAPLPAPPADRTRRESSGADLELSAAERSRLARLEFENAELRSRLAAQTASLAGAVDRAERDALASEVETLKTLVARQEGENRRLASRITTLDAELGRNRTAADSARVERERLAASEAALRKELEQATARAKTEEARFQAQLAESRNAMTADVASLDARIKQLGDQTRDLQTRLKTAETERDAAKAELAKVAKPASPMAPAQPDPAQALRQELDRLRMDLETKSELVTRLEKELTASRATAAAERKADQEKIRALESRLAAAPAVPRADASRRDTDWTSYPVEAKRPDDLWPGAMPLFQALQASRAAGESVTDRDRNLVAGRLGELVGRFYFRDGLATLDTASRTALEEAAAALPDDSFLLVAGYASVRGKSTANERLSSRRAAHVAASLRPHVPTGKAQILYFGETSQFDPRDQAKNRVVEVWRVPR